MIKKVSFWVLSFLLSFYLFSFDINELKSFVEKERGLKFKKEIELKKITSKEAENIIKKEIESQYNKYSLQNYEEALKIFKLIPRKSNLKDMILSLLSSQVIAFYDTKSKKLYFSEDFSLEDDPLFNLNSSFDLSSHYLVHELVHALVDQNFDIEKNLKLNDVNNEDRQLTSLAIIEGDATYIMLKYLMKNKNVKNISENLLTLLRELKNFGYMMGEIAPLYLRETLLFPYVYGLNFFIKVEENKGDFNALYKNPPISTEEIIHPEKYLTKNDPPKKCSLSASKIKGEIIWEGTFGEYGIYLVLRSWGVSDDIAKKATEGWGNDKYVVFKKKESRELSYIWETVWDSENDANEFAKAIKDERLKIKKDKNIVILEKN